MFWLAPDTLPTLGDWFRAGGYRTYFKGKWHASHAHLEAEDRGGFLLSIDDDATPLPENINTYLKADPLDEYGFSEWVGPSRTGRASPRPRRRCPSTRRRADSTKVEVIVAVMTVGKPIPVSLATEATTRPRVLVGTTSP